MIDEIMALRRLMEKSADADLLREMTGFAAERLMELDVGGLTGAAHSEKRIEWLVQRNGYRDRDWQTRVGTVKLHLWIDVTYVKVRNEGRVVSVAVIVAIGGDGDGRSEVLSMDIGSSDSPSDNVWLGLSGRDGGDSRRVLRPDLDGPCGPRPLAGSIAVRTFDTKPT